MATLSRTPTATSLSISGTTSKSGTISWTCPTVPEGCMITSCVLTGIPSISMTRGNATVTVNGEKVTNGEQFTIDLGTSNTTNSVSTTGKGSNGNSRGTVTFTALSYMVTYQDKVEEGGEEGEEGGEGTTTNIMPSFLTGDWYLPSGCTFISATDTDYSFNVTETWNGLALSMPTEWAGKTITFGCTDISSNAGFYIQNNVTWDDIVILTASSKKVTVTIPTGITATMCLQASSTVGVLSITGLYAYEGDGSGGNEGGDDSGGDEGGDEGGGDIGGGDTQDKITHLQLGNRVVGYIAPSNETVISGATTVSTATALTTAIANANAGTTIYVKAGTYTFSGGLNINKSGTSSNYITIKNYPNETPIIKNSSITFASGVKYVNFEGFKIQDLIDLDWDKCLTVSNGCSYINLRNLEITNIKCKTSASETGCNPLVLYGDGTNPITNCLIENCYVHDCDTGWSEAITLNGNVTDCVVRNCCVDNTKNIAIDLAGNFSWTGTVGNNTNQARNTIVENNLVMNCQSPYATSAGLYCDGGRDNTFRYNVVYNAQCGIELGAEEPGATVQNFHVYGNLIIDSGRSIGVGGYQSTSATHQNTYIYNNTFVCGDSNEENCGLMLERTSNVHFVNNIIYGTSNTNLLETGANATNLNITNNCWYKVGETKPTEDTTGISGDPLFINNNGLITGDYTLQESSPCIDSGINSSELYRGNLDLNGNNRLVGIIDIGAFESNFKEIIQNIKIGQSGVKTVYLGTTEIGRIYMGNILIYDKNIISSKYERISLSWTLNKTISSSSGNVSSGNGNAVADVITIDSNYDYFISTTSDVEYLTMYCYGASGYIGRFGNPTYLSETEGSYYSGTLNKYKLPITSETTSFRLRVAILKSADWSDDSGSIDRVSLFRKLK